MGLSVTIRTSSAAFANEPSRNDEEPEPFPDMACRTEVAGLLREVAQKIEDGEDVSYFRPISDTNGGKVGQFRLVPDEEED